MALPSNYTRVGDFSDDESSSVAGRSTVQTTVLDSELDRIASIIADINTNLGYAIRSDGGIKDNFIKPQGFGLSDANGFIKYDIATNTWSFASDPLAESNIAKNDTQKLATNPEDSQYTLSDGTTGYSALHYNAKASASSTSASSSSSTASSKATEAENWATKTDGVVPSTSEYSAKEYSQGSQASTGGSSKNWASQTGSTVTGDGSGFSAKEHAEGSTVTGGSAKDWATKAEDSAVSGGEFSAKHWSAKSQSYADAAASGEGWGSESNTIAYVSATSFTVAADVTGVYVADRRIYATVGGNPFYSHVVSATYSAPNTTIVIYDSILTSSLTAIKYSVLFPGASGNLPPHDHSTDEVGGVIQQLDWLESSVVSNTVRILESDGLNMVHTTAGVVDEFNSSTDAETAIDASNSTNEVYDASADTYSQVSGSAGQTTDFPYTTENSYLQQEWTTAIVGSSNATFTNSSATVTISSGTWPANCDNGRITQDGTNWYDIASRDSTTQLTLSSNFSQSTVTGTYTIRMTEFSGGKVKLNTAYGAESINQQQTTVNEEAANLDNTARTHIAQSFTPSITGKVTKIQIHLWKGSSNTPTDNLKLSIQKGTLTGINDGDDLPDGTDLSNVVTIDASTLTTSAAEYTYTFSTEPDLTADIPYWIVIERGTPASDGGYKVNRNTSGGDYARGRLKYKDGGTWANVAGDDDCTFKVYMSEGSTVITEPVTTVPSFATLKDASAWSDMNSVAITDTPYSGAHTVNSTGGGEYPISNSDAKIKTSGNLAASDVTDSATISSPNHQSGTLNDLRVDNTSGAVFNNVDDGNDPVTIKYDLGSGNDAIAISYTIKVADSVGNSGNQDPYGWTFQGSTNDSSWTVLDTETAVNWTSNYQSQTFTFSNSTSYRYYKIVVTDQGTDGTTTTASLYLTSFRVQAAGVAVSPKIGTGMGYFDDGDKLTIPEHDDFTFGAGNYTIEAWVNIYHLTNAGDMGIIQLLREESAYNWSLYYHDSGKFKFEMKPSGSNTATILDTSTTLVAGTWYHVAVVRNGTTTSLYLNGTSEDSATWDYTMRSDAGSVNEEIGIGHHVAASFWHGWMDELRISKGIARYTTNFTPSTTQFDTDANTSLLLHMDGADDSTTFNDSSHDTYHYYSVIHMPTGVSAYNDTNVKVVVWTGTVWKEVARYYSSAWQRNTDTADSTATTWTNATVNDMVHAISEAIENNTRLRMKEADVEGISDANWEAAGGLTIGTTVKVGMAVTMKSESTTGNSTTDLIQFNYDGSNTALDLRTKQWAGSSGMPSAPSAVTTVYVFGVDNNATATWYYTTDGASYTQISSWDDTWDYATGKTARRKTISLPGGTGTDPRIKITTALGGAIYTLSAIGLQVR